MAEDEKGQILLNIARLAIGQELGLNDLEMPKADWLQEKKATFVTLHRNGELRGCIGSIEAYQPLSEDIRKNAIASAFEDGRFPQLRKEEFETLEIEVSVLTPLQPLTFKSEEDAISQFRPGIDGIVFQSGFHRATYLPQVWEKLPEPRRFLASLKQKAGLPKDFWDGDIRLFRYTMVKYEENRQ